MKFKIGELVQPTEFLRNYAKSWGSIMPDDDFTRWCLGSTPTRVIGLPKPGHSDFYEVAAIGKEKIWRMNETEIELALTQLLGKI